MFKIYRSWLPQSQLDSHQILYSSQLLLNALSLICEEELVQLSARYPSFVRLFVCSVGRSIVLLFVQWRSVTEIWGGAHIQKADLLGGAQI